METDKIAMMSKYAPPPISTKEHVYNIEPKRKSTRIIRITERQQLEKEKKEKIEQQLAKLEKQKKTNNKTSNTGGKKQKTRTRHAPAKEQDKKQHKPLPTIGTIEVPEIKIATWNVFNLGGKMEHIKTTTIIDIMEEQHIDILAIQEHKISGLKDHLEARDLHKYRFYFSEVEHKVNGVGIIARKDIDMQLGKHVMISDRVMRMDFVVGQLTYVIVNIYAPTNDKSTEIKEDFYSKTTQYIKKLKTEWHSEETNKRLIVLGDFNARVAAATETIDSPIDTVVGEYSNDETNENGWNMIKLAQLTQSCIADTMIEELVTNEDILLEETRYKEFANTRGTYRHAPSQRWWTPDHILCQQQDLKYVEKIQIYRKYGGIRNKGADFTDHRMMIMTMSNTIDDSSRRKLFYQYPKQDQQRRKNHHHLQWDIEAFKNLTTQQREEIATDISGRFHNLQQNNKMHHTDILQQLCIIAKEKKLLRSPPKSIKKQWLIEDPHFRKLDKQVRELKACREKYAGEKKEIKKAERQLQKLKKKILTARETQLGGEISQLEEEGNIRKLYLRKEAIQKRGEGIPVDIIELKDGTTTRDPIQIANRMKEYISELLGKDDREVNMEDITRVMNRTKRRDTNQDLAKDITWKEVEKAIKKYKNNKAQGPGNPSHQQQDICIEILKYAKVETQDEGTNKDFRVQLAQWYTQALQTGEMTSDIALIRCMMLPKVAGTRKMDKFRGISIMNTLRRLLSMILVARIDGYLEQENIYMENQFGFRRNKSIIQPCQILQHLQWLSATRGKDIYITFIDIAKAYDKVNWEILWKIMDFYGLPDKIITLLRYMFENSEMAIQFQGKLGEWFKLGQGVPQGDPISPLLFSIYLGFLFKEYLQVMEQEQLNQQSAENTSQDIGVQLYYINQKQLIPEPRIEIQRQTAQKWNSKKKIWEQCTDGNGNIKLNTKNIYHEPHVIPVAGTDELHVDAKSYRLTELLYADDTTIFSESLQTAMSRTHSLYRAAKAGGLNFNISKCHWMKISNETQISIDKMEEQEQEQFILEGIKLQRVFSENYLGSTYISQYDKGLGNIKKRIAMARAKMNKDLNEINNNRKIPWKVKMRFYMSDILSVLLHGVQYWHITPDILTKLEQFQRESLLKILDRTYRDRISSVDIYLWMKTRKIKIYPIEIIIQERQVRYYSDIISYGMSKEEVASKLYWSDIKAKCNIQEFEYKHITNIRNSLKFLKISEVEANKEFAEQKTWRRKLLQQKDIIFEEWIQMKKKIKEERAKKALVTGEEQRRIEEEKMKNGGWMYKPRPLPL
jgi:hypothetical protein